jgi:predicted CDP-diglyceride synthetase/phosphatidate cytidylyltransferase
MDPRFVEIEAEILSVTLIEYSALYCHESEDIRNIQTKANTWQSLVILVLVGRYGKNYIFNVFTLNSLFNLL